MFMLDSGSHVVWPASCASAHHDAVHGVVGAVRSRRGVQRRVPRADAVQRRVPGPARSARRLAVHAARHLGRGAGSELVAQRQLPRSCGEAAQQYEAQLSHCVQSDMVQGLLYYSKERLHLPQSFTPQGGGSKSALSASLASFCSRSSASRRASSARPPSEAS